MSDLMYPSAVQLITEACIQAEYCSKTWSSGSSSESSYIVRILQGYTITGRSGLVVTRLPAAR